MICKKYETASKFVKSYAEKTVDLFYYRHGVYSHKSQ